MSGTSIISGISGDFR